MSFAHYLQQVNLYLIVFYAGYKILLDKETYFTLNRIYLVSAGILSLSIPFIRLEWLTEQKAAQQVYATVNWDAVLQQATIVTESDTPFNWGNIFVYIYCAGILFFLGRLVFNLVAVKSLLKAAKSGSAFSFFSKKVIDQQLPQVEVINLHEEIHIKQWHTVDILFFELIGILTWLNPVVYLYQKSIKNIHEFLADEQAAAFQGDKAEYALLILSQSFGISPNTLANGFFDKSLIKKRIFMLQKDRSKKTAILKYGIFIPLFAIFIIFSSATIRKNKKLIAIADQIPLEKPIDLVQDIVTKKENNLSIAEISSKEKAIDKKELKTLKSTENKNIVTEAFTQTETPVQPQESADHNKVFDFVSIEKQPEFPGGISKFYKYLGGSIKYPAKAQENNVQGKVFLSFIVEKDGSLSDVQITRGLSAEIDKEALRVISESPKWNPGINNGNAVRVKYNINVNFTLNSESVAPRPTTFKSIKAVNLLTNNTANGISNSLIIVDGVKMSDDYQLNAINPNNIESVSILKDQAATSMYGVRAKSGAIIITTKTKDADLFKKLSTKQLASDKTFTNINQ